MDDVPGSEPATLRERKKQRTRTLLVSAALDLFEQRGYTETTLDDLCAAAEVSKRTFFRYFRGKEDVVLEPGHDLWTALIDDLTDRDLGTDPLITVLQRGVLAVVAARADGEWPTLLRRSRRLAATHPAIDAAGLWWCELTSTEIATIISGRTGTASTDPRPRLCVDLVVHTLNGAVARWAADPATSDGPDLVDAVRDGFAVLPELLSYRVSPAG